LLASTTRWIARAAPTRDTRRDAPRPGGDSCQSAVPNFRITSAAFQPILTQRRFEHSAAFAASGEDDMSNGKRLLVAGLVTLACVASSASHAAPQSGWYWDPAQSGRGFFVESTGDMLYMAGYIYANDGHALWVVAGDATPDPYSYSGHLYSFSGGQTLTGAYKAPTGSQDLGAMSLHFSDDTHAVLTWSGETIPLERDIFGSGPAAFQPQTGWWWNPNESGRGYNIEVQGNALFFIGSMYDDDGRPVWYLSAGPVGEDPSTYSGPLLQLANGQAMGAPYKLPTIASTVGSLDLAFTGTNKATLTFSRTSATQDGAKDAAQSTIDITPQFIKDGDFSPPEWFEGSFTMNANLDGVTLAGGLGTGYQHDTYKGDHVTWEVKSIDLSTQTALYIMRGANITLTTQAQSQVTVPDVGTATCTLTANGSAAVSFPFTGAAYLSVDAYAHYEMKLELDKSQLDVHGTLTCVGPGGGVLEGFDPPPLPDIPANFTGLVGPVINPGGLALIAGDLPLETTPAPGGLGTYSLGGSYQFVESDECDTPFCPEEEEARAASGLSSRLPAPAQRLPVNDALLRRTR
jgi:hypothetical protein